MSKSMAPDDQKSNGLNLQPMKLYKAFHDSVQTTGPILLAATFIRHSSYTKTLFSPICLPSCLYSYHPFHLQCIPTLPHFLNIWYLTATVRVPPPPGSHLPRSILSKFPNEIPPCP